jgi:hypothetical protein
VAQASRCPLSLSWAIHSPSALSLLVLLPQPAILRELRELRERFEIVSIVQDDSESTSRLSLSKSIQDPRITRHFATTTAMKMAALSTAANSAAVPTSAPTSIGSMHDSVERESEELLMMFSTSPDRMTHSTMLASSIRGDNVWLARATGAVTTTTTATTRSVMASDYHDERYGHTRTPMPILPKSTAAETAGFSHAIPISALVRDDHNHDER